MPLFAPLVILKSTSNSKLLYFLSVTISPPFLDSAPPDDKTFKTPSSITQPLDGKDVNLAPLHPSVVFPSHKKLQTLSLIPIVVISLFYLAYLIKWEPIIVGVFRELLLLPSILAQLVISVYFLFKIFKKESKINAYILLNFLFTFLLILSFNI